MMPKTKEVVIEVGVLDKLLTKAYFKGKNESYPDFQSWMFNEVNKLLEKLYVVR